MKNKPLRHKETNTFRFQPFSERISNIDIDIFHRVGHEYETQSEENKCLFYQAVEKWDVLNLTEYYNTFRKEIHANSLITLPQLIHSKDNVVQVLLKHLRYKNVLCLQALLELVVALANDLRKDFYLYYPEFLSVLVDLLNTKDTEQLEWTFTCLAYLFKFLWRPLTKDVNTVFNSVLPLLSDSKPDYINNFAAESFAFVVRKVKERHSFLSLLLKVVKNNRDGVSGCGKLLFEVMHGVQGQFHSCADTMLPLLLESLANNKLPQGILFEILEEVVMNIVSNIYPQKSELFWKTCINILEKLSQEWILKQTDDVAKNMKLILKLVGQALEYRNGKFLQMPVPVVQIILKLLSLSDLPEKVLLVISQVTILLLLSTNVRLPQEQASALTRKILCVPKKTLLHFVDHVTNYTSFEALVLPTFLKHCIENDLDSNSLHVLTRLILRKSPLCGSGLNLESWTKYPLDFNSKQHNTKIFNTIMKYVDIDDIKVLQKNFENYMCGVICLPHLIFDQNITQARNTINNNIRLLCENIQNEAAHSTNDNNMKQLLLILLNTLECAVHITSIEDLLLHTDLIINVVLPLTSNVTLLASLKILNLYLSAVRNEESVICMDVLRKLHLVLEGNFNSPYHEIRLLTAHTYTLFENIPDLKPATATEDWKVFSLCYNVESISPQIQTYRDQTQNLERLSCDKPQMNMCKHTEFKMIPLRYLCGVLYMNFKLLWEPTVNILATHAQGLEVADFWKVFVEELKTVIGNVKEPLEIKDYHLESECSFLKELYKQTYGINDKPDFANYRLLLWKAMEHFPELAEAKTRDVSELLLKFMEEEYMKSNSDIALMWNIKQNTNEESVMDVDDQNEDEEIQVIKKELTKAVPQTKGSSNWKTLQHHLIVFSKVRSPKSMYRETELYKLYVDLLSHKNHEIQKLALDCIMTYKHKYLTPYREHLYQLIDEKNFKDELATFRVDKESSIVQEGHREHLIPIVLKIVYSKMFAKTGLRTGGKSSGQLRRNLVLRFLAGCHENEMLNFIHMAFRFYTKYFEDDIKQMIENVSKNIDLEKFIPPKRLQSTLNLLTVVLEQFGGLMGQDLLSFLLKVLFVIGAAIKGAFEQLSNVHAGYLSILRNLRTSCIKIVERFFGHFENYVWSSEEINGVFNVFVWPYLDKLTIEGIHSPTSLLKLFIQWGSNPRYFPLLMKYETNNKAQYVLPHIMKLLLNKQSHGSVVNSILEMFEKLLSLIPDEEELELAIPIDDLLPINDDILARLKLNEKLNYGSCILLPHVPSILEIIKRKLEGKSKNINQRELFILSRISELVWEAEISNEVLKLLLPVMLKKCSSGEETVLKYVTTVSNLLQNVHEPQSHFKQLSPFFGYISHVSSRKILCGIMETISKRFHDPKLTLLATLISQFNAWDAKWVDQPDFQRRLDGFKQVQSMIENDSLDITLGVIIIYNCYYTIRSENDLSLKESASHCWRNVSSTLVKKYENHSKELDYILNDILFLMIRKGFKNKNDEVRNECILLLGHLARECPNAHVVLRDLNKLTNKADIEVDFFENMTHLQLHRHSRALLKFGQVYRQEENAPSPRTLTQFVLPLATFYLCSEKYAQKNSLIDSAIDVVATVSKLLPWHQYQGLLKYYLTRLRHKVEYQKQLVRLMVAILDAFHFDLSKGHVKVVPPRGGIAKLLNTEAATSKNDEKVSENKDSEVVENEQVADEVKKEKGEDGEVEEEVDEALEKLAEEVDEEEEEEEEKTVEKIMAVEKVRVLCQSTATSVIRTIQSVMLPQLHRALAEMTHHESSHKVNRKRTGFEREEEDLLRVPISLAVVKLLQRLPKGILESNLPGVFMKLCTFLKSQLESVRRVTRETLQKIMLTLGPQYLGLLLEEMSPLLARGFHVHVLVYTVHSVLVCLKDKYQPTDLDKILLPVLGLCKIDLFGSVAEEKEIEKIGRKTSEAKSTKSFDTLQILAQYMTDKCLMDILLPIKTVLTSSHSFKVVHKAQESLRHIALGLVENEFAPLESLLKFAYGTSSESIPELLASREKDKLNQKQKQKLLNPKSDCFIIPQAPVGRSGFRRTGVKFSDKANAHILVEFGLRLCHYLLKKEKLRDDEYKPFIDPFVDVFKNCLNSRHVKLSTLTLQCLSRIMKYDLPSMKENVAAIAESMFAILHKYAAAGLSKGDNFELVVAVFKAMAVLVRDVKYHTIDTEQLKILLLYVEQDLHNYDRQATAFALLRAIISRKLMTLEIHAVMDKVAELSITSELPHVRLQARLVFHQFLMDYPLKNKVTKHIAFYISQLNYELQFGRESAIEMLQSLILSFPVKILVEHSGTFFVNLGARLVNDEVAQCKKMIADCLTAMFKRLPRPDIDPLFDIIIMWLKDRKLSHKQLAAQVCGLLVMVEKSSFETRLPILIPVILNQFGLGEGSNKPGRFVLLKHDTVDEDTPKDRVKDHQLYQVLQMLLKICAQCPSFLKPTEDLQLLSEYIQTLLSYPHEWVRLAAAQFLGFVLSSLDIDKLANLLILSEGVEIGYLYSDPFSGIKSLSLDLCAQLQPGSIKSDLAEQVIKNLVFIARVLQKVPLDDKQNDQKINLHWLTKRLRKIVNMEVVETPTSIVLRTEVFKWVAGVGTALELEKVTSVLHHLLAPLVREMITTEESDAPLRQLSKEVGNLLKKRVGMELYTNTLNKLQQHLAVRRAERKRERNQLAVTDPEMYAKKKIKMHEKKKEAKKRKISQRKGTVRKFKKQKVVELADSSEVM